MPRLIRQQNIRMVSSAYVGEGFWWKPDLVCGLGFGDSSYSTYSRPIHHGLMLPYLVICRCKLCSGDTKTVSPLFAWSPWGKWSKVPWMCQRLPDPLLKQIKWGRLWEDCSGELAKLGLVWDLNWEGLGGSSALLGLDPTRSLLGCMPGKELVYIWGDPW